MDFKTVPILDRLIATMTSRKMRGVRFIRRVFGSIHSLREVEFVNKYGVRLLLREDYIDNIIITEGYYESEVLEAMLSNSPRNSVVWDIGANFGLHAVTLKVLRPDVKVICFEPSPLQAARILLHARLNGVALEVIGVGLGEAAGYADLHVNDRGNPGMTTFIPWSEATYDLTLLSPIDSGDRLLEETRLGRPSLIKIDVEGGEIAALSGLKNLLRRGCTTIIFEGGADTADYVRSLGYKEINPCVRKEHSDHNLDNFVARAWSIEINDESSS